MPDSVKSQIAKAQAIEAAWKSLASEVHERNEKTARLREARLAKEAAAASAATKKTTD